MLQVSEFNLAITLISFRTQRVWLNIITIEIWSRIIMHGNRLLTINPVACIISEDPTQHRQALRERIHIPHAGNTISHHRRVVHETNRIPCGAKHS